MCWTLNVNIYSRDNPWKEVGITKGEIPEKLTKKLMVISERRNVYEQII